MSTRLGFKRSHNDQEKTPWRTVQSIEKSAALRYIVSGGAYSDYSASCLGMYMHNYRFRLANEAAKAQAEARLAEKDRHVGALLLRVKDERRKMHVLRDHFGLMAQQEAAAGQVVMRSEPTTGKYFDTAISEKSGATPVLPRSDPLSLQDPSRSERSRGSRSASAFRKT
jgi:hypothetical protein